MPEADENKAPLMLFVVANLGLRRLLRSFSHLVLMRGKGRQHFGFFVLRHGKMIERARQHRRHGVELLWRDPQIPVGFLKPEFRASRSHWGILERPARYIGNPQ